LVGFGSTAAPIITMTGPNPFERSTIVDSPRPSRSLEYKQTHSLASKEGGTNGRTAAAINGVNMGPASDLDEAEYLVPFAAASRASTSASASNPKGGATETGACDSSAYPPIHSSIEVALQAKNPR